MTEQTRRWSIGDLVQKRQRSKWRGRVVGFYSTAETPEGYNVESLFEPGSCQLWPLAALDDWDGTGTTEQLKCELNAANAEIARLRERLEVDDDFNTDGIECRDDTIKLLDEKCAALRAALQEIRDVAPVSSDAHALADMALEPAISERARDLIETEVATLRVAGAELVAAIDQMVEDTVPMFAEMELLRGRPYAGKQIGEELEAFRGALGESQ
ncbi:MAG: hypothetical protein RQ750_13865 [Roseovarius sp.]|nr:hypothetical protein [Roseovarius sp.]